MLCPTRGSSFPLGKVTALGVLCCFALFVLACLFFSFLIKTCTLCTCYIITRGRWESTKYSNAGYSSFPLGNVTALGVLCCFALFVCLTMLASSSFLIKTCTCIYMLYNLKTDESHNLIAHHAANSCRIL